MNDKPHVDRRRGWIKRSLIVALAGLVVLAGLLVGGIRLLDHFAPQYRDALADRIGQRIGANVSVSGLEIGWGWHGPILYLDDPRITHRGADRPALSAARLGLEFSPTDLIGGSRLPDGLIVDHPRAALVQQGGRLQLAHWPTSAGPGIDWSKLETVRRRLDHVRIDDGRLTITADRLPGGRMQWSNVNATLDDRAGRHLKLSASALGPAWWPKLAVSATLDGPLADPERAHFSVHGARIQPLAVARRDHARLASKLRGGRLSFDADGHWRDHRLTDTRIRINGAALYPQGDEQPLVPAFSAMFQAASDPHAKHIDLQLARLTGGPQRSHTVDAAAHFDTQSRALSVTARHLPGALALQLARIGQPRLADTTVDGSIDALKLDWQPGRPLAATVDFSGLAVDDPRIAFGPIAGRYHQQGDHHSLHFDGAGGELSAPRYIQGAVDITGLGGGVSWQPDGHGGWAIDLDKLRLASRKAHLSASGRVHLPGDGRPPVVDLSADAVAPDAPRLLAHIPQAEDLPNPKLRDWLPKAIRAGSLDHGHVEIKGPMDRFPFAKGRDGNGFHMTLAGHGLDVHYKPGWPALADARGRVSLDGERLALDLAGAKMLGVDIGSAKARIDDVREPVMHLTGTANNAPASKLMAFLSQSPLHDKFDKLVDALDVAGPTDLGVKLRIPLKPGHGDVRVDGHVDARGDSLRQDALPGPITDIDGRIAFSDHGVTASGLTGRLSGVPVSADITKAADGGQRISARARPRLPDDRAILAHYLPSAWLVYGRGETPMTIAFTVQRSGQISPIRVHSDLAGMALDLPAPLHKKAAAAAPLTVTIDSDSGHIEADYDHRLHMAVRLNNQDQPRRIQVRLGHTGVTPPDSNGLWIGGHADRVDGLGWFYVVRHVLYGAPANVPGATQSAGADATAPQQKSGEDTDLAFLGGDLTIDRLEFGDRYIAGSHLRAEPMHDAPGWRVNLEGDDSQGQITWTMPAGRAPRIAGNLKRIAVHTESTAPDAPSANDNASDSSVLWPELAPSDLPALKLYVQNFAVNDTDFGQMHVDAHTGPTGWTLERFQLAGGALTGTARARWQRDSGVDQASAHVDFDGKGLSRLLRTLGYVSPIQAQNARIKSDLTIKPNDHGLDLRYLDGRVHLALDHGTLLSVEPGPGRLLGLLNLYVLPRRLRLDFRDVVDKGMAFDKVRADFDIRQGQAYSKNARILTPSAKIGVTGRIGLATRDYDEYVTITPKVGSGVAIASTVLGGPIVGAVVFTVQQLLKKPIQNLSSVGYQLKGSWDNPQIVNPRADAANPDHDDGADTGDSESDAR